MAPKWNSTIQPTWRRLSFLSWRHQIPSAHIFFKSMTWCVVYFLLKFTLRSNALLGLSIWQPWFASKTPLSAAIPHSRSWRTSSWSCSTSRRRCWLSVRLTRRRASASKTRRGKCSIFSTHSHGRYPLVSSSVNCSFFSLLVRSEQLIIAAKALR